MSPAFEMDEAMRWKRKIIHTCKGFLHANVRSAFNLQLLRSVDPFSTWSRVESLDLSLERFFLLLKVIGSLATIRKHFGSTIARDSLGKKPFFLLVVINWQNYFGFACQELVSEGEVKS
jgi:hypothetical protein